MKSFAIFLIAFVVFLYPNRLSAQSTSDAPQMQMNPVEEETAASLKNVIFGETRAPELNQITLPSTQQEQINCGLGKLTTREDLKKSSDYVSADALWDQRHEGWNRHFEIHRTLQEKLQEKKLAEEKVQEATEADESRDENQLGQFKQRLEQLASTLHYVPEPHMQVVATAVDTTASALHWINKIWTKKDLVQAKFLEDRAQKAHQQAKIEAEQATMAIVNLEQQARKSEEEALAREQHKKLGESLRPRGGWGEHEWVQWSDSLLPKIDSHASAQERENQEHAKRILAQQGPLNIPWVTEQTATAWQERLKKSKEQLQLLTQESKKTVMPLQRSFDQAEKVVKKKIEATEQIHTLLQAAQRREKELKQTIETFFKNHVQGAQSKEWNQQKINQDRQEFCHDFESLIKNHSDIEGLQKKWEEALQQEHDERLQTLSISQQLESKKEEYQRLLRRAQACLQADQEQLRKVWPEYDITFRPYLQWELPFIEESEELLSNNAASKTEESFTSEKSFEVEPPQELQEEREARGRRYLYQAKKEREQELNPPSRLETTTSVKISSVPTSEETTPRETESSTSSDIILTPHEALLAWSLEQVDRPGIAEQQRWAARRQLDLCREETKKVAQALQQESQKEEETETGTVITWITGKTKAQKTPTRISGFTTGTRSTATTMESSSSPTENFQEQFQQALLVEKKAEERWLELMRQADKVRVGEPFQSPEAAIDAWAYVDRQAVEEQQRRKELLLEKRAAEAKEKGWKENNERWRARTQADLAKQRLEDLQKEQSKLPLRKELTEFARQQKTNELQREVAQANAEFLKADEVWLKLAQQQKSILKAQQDGDWDAPESAEEEQKRTKKVAIALEQLKDFDRAVLQRWSQFQESQGPLDIEKVAALQQRSSYALELGVTLEEAEKTAFETAPWVEEGIKKYQQAATQEAFRAARENIPESAKAWEERVRRGTQQLQEWERQITDPNTPSNNVANFRDRLPQLRGVVAADQKVQATFAKEKHRLDKIEGLWKNIMIAQKEAQFQKAQEAARYHSQGDSTAWNNLTDEERQGYNDQIVGKNRTYDEKLRKEEEALAEMKKQLDLEQAKATRFLSRVVGAITGQQEAALTFLKEVQEHYEQRYHDWDQHQKALRWAGLTSEEKKAELILEEEKLAFEKLKVQMANVPELIKEANKKAKVAKENYNSYEGAAWDNYIKSLTQSVFAFKKHTAVVAEQFEILKFWKKTAVQYHRAAECYQKEAEACGAEIVTDKRASSSSWNNAGNGFYNVAENLVKAIKANAAKKPEEVKKYYEVVEAYERSGKSYISYIHSKTTESKKGFVFFNNAGDSFYNAAGNLEKAIEAENANKLEVAKQYSEAALQYTNSGESYMKSKERNINTDCDYYGAGFAFNNGASNLLKAIKADLAGRAEEAKKYREVAEQYKRSGEYAITESSYTFNACFGSLAFKDAAEKLEKEIEAESVGKVEEALKWRRVAEAYKLAGKLHIQSDRAYAIKENAEESERWKKAGQSWSEAGFSFINVAEKLEKAIKLESVNKVEEALQWHKVAEAHKCTGELYAEMGAAYSRGQIDRFDPWDDDVKKEAEKLEKAIVSDEVGDLEVAKKWREAAEQNAYSVEYLTQSLRAHIEGETDKSISCGSAAYAFYEAAESLEMAIEVESAGKPEIAQKYREVAMYYTKAAIAYAEGKPEVALKYREAAEHYTKTAAAYAAGNLNEGNCWHRASNIITDWAYAIEIAIDTEGEGKPKVALEWREHIKRLACFVEFFTKAAVAYAEGKTKEAACWKKAGIALQRAAWASNSEAIDKLEWREAAEQFTLSADLFTKAAADYFEGNEAEGDRLKSEGESIFNSAEETTKEDSDRYSDYSR
ncbi:MAG: hypothetical protein A3F67_04680 [Verrucomicrobia bacterium RIFCSPHIGHO2_12_FULL_41_10]|nr:MAG: hypothetical protein A3F67_04680 [Verrucomicrobia bacterium RIFCSPHIGHO2_12_FULL_41_10]